MLKLPTATSQDKTIAQHTTAPSPHSHIFTKFVTNLFVRPQQQTRISLGHFSSESPAKGFSIALSPEPASDESVITRVLHLRTPAGYELVLQVANYGNTHVSAEVWQM